MISLDAALALYGRHVSPLPVTSVPLIDACNRVLAAPALAAIDLPRFSQSALDGYVLHADDLNGRAPLPIVATIAAGDTGALSALSAGSCQRILTGARVPPDAAAVIGQEHVLRQDQHIVLQRSSTLGANIRIQGEECLQGSTLAHAGQRLNPGLIASLASGGVAQVQVTAAPRIAVLISGDELVPLGQPLAAGQIWDSNGPLVQAWLQNQGYSVSRWHLPDQRAAVSQALDHALATHDLVITTGGVSVGDKDHIIPAAESVGVVRGFWQVAQKPGKPLYFGTRNGRVLLGLPGNPGAVLVGLAVHARTAINHLENLSTPGPRFNLGQLQAPVKADAQRDRLVRMRLGFSASGTAQLHPLPYQDSHMLTNLDQASVLVRLPSVQAPYAAGALLPWMWL